jgi:hypothetical protein
VPAEHDVGMRRGHRRIENRTQERASVGHRILGPGLKREAVIRFIHAKENPRGPCPRGCCVCLLADKPWRFSRRRRRS